MTGPGKPRRDRALADLFARDADEAVLSVLQNADAPLAAGEIKQALLTRGVAKADADGAWPRVQRRLRAHEQVLVEKRHYSWMSQPREISAAEALDLVAKGRPTAERKAELLALVRAALITPRPAPGAAARQRQAEIDAMRALAELASEVEELTASEVETSVLVRQVRAWANRSGLEPIERAGAETRFDRKRHKPIGPSIRDGAPVLVVRPGYIWKAPSEEVLIAKAIVEE